MNRTKQIKEIPKQIYYSQNKMQCINDQKIKYSTIKSVMYNTQYFVNI